MPFPDLKDVDKAERAKALKEMTRRQTLSAGKLTLIFLEQFYSNPKPNSIHFHLVFQFQDWYLWALYGQYTLLKGDSSLVI